MKATHLLFALTCLFAAGCWNSARAQTPAQTWRLIAPYDATVVEVHVQVGDAVKKGDPLATLDVRELELQLAATRARAEAMALRAETHRAENRTAEARIVEAEREAILAEVNLIQLQIEKGRLIAPANSVVLQSEARPGTHLPRSSLVMVIGAVESKPNELEQQFQEMLTGATLVGHYTADGREPREEKYTIEKVSKFFGDRWLINARIQFGDKDVTVPIVVPVKWAGDTPMISVTDLGIPGLGTYTARVIFYRDQYAGTWSGGGRGGHLWGRIERAPVNPAEPAEQRR